LGGGRGEGGRGRLRADGKRYAASCATTVPRVADRRYASTGRCAGRVDRRRPGP